ncbi:MAG: hypothetical protein JWO38_1593 [Gemmataceae bacterium]|nr:hypothetical protein [Gemmataceae bacterium]
MGGHVRPGETCVVVVKQAPLQKGDQLVVRVPKGTRLTVQRTRDEWVRTTYRVGDTTHEGWIEAAFLAPAPKFDPSRPAKFSDAYDRLARAVAMPELGPNPELLGRMKNDPVKGLADLKGLIAELKAVAGAETGDLKPLAKDILEEFEWFAKMNRAVLKHPDYAGLPRDSEGGFVFSARPVPQVAVEQKEVKPDESLNALRAKVLHSIEELRTLALRVADVARKTGGPRVERGQALAVDFVEPYVFEGMAYYDLFGARDPFDNPDRLRLTNAAGVELTHCTVLVKVIGETETRHNVHYVPKWAAGQTLMAHYYAGIPMGQKTVMRFSCRAVKRLEVSVWADQLSQEGIRYEYDSREKEFAFREYVDRAQFVAGCERYDGLLGRGYRVDVSFKEAMYFPTAKLTVRVKRDGEWTERAVTATRWRAGAVESVDFADVDGKDVKPSEYEVVLEATYHDWVHRRHLSWKNE